MGIANVRNYLCSGRSVDLFERGTAIVHAYNKYNNLAVNRHGLTS